MLHVNEDNDGIFRRAAEAYPLDTGHGNWEAMRKKLSHPDEEEEPVITPLNRNYLALMIFAFLGLGLPLLTRDLLHPNLHQASLEKKNSTVNQIELGDSKPNLSNVPVLETNKTGKETGFKPLERKTALYALPGNGKQNMFPPASIAPGQDNELATDKDLSKQLTNVKTQPDTVPQQTAEKAITPDKQIASSSTEPDKRQKKKSKKIYAGVIGGADISMIKLQGANKIGHSYGIRIGYTINSRIAVESGIQADKKFYKTSGQYFNTKKIRLPQYAEIVSAAGNCDMYEVPLQVRYSFKQKKKTGISVFAGASAYMMKKEDYTYQVKRNNYIYPRNVSYNKSDTRIIAAINTGFTVQHKLGRSGNLIAEPYIKLPVSHMGTGLLPIQSAGIQLGYTRSIF